MIDNSTKDVFGSTVSAVLVDEHGTPLYTCLKDKSYRGVSVAPDFAERNPYSCCERTASSEESYRHASSHWAFCGEGKNSSFCTATSLKRSWYDTPHSNAESNVDKQMAPSRQWQVSPLTIHPVDRLHSSSSACAHSSHSFNQRGLCRSFRMFIAGVGGFVVGGSFLVQLEQRSGQFLVCTWFIKLM